MGFPTAQDQSSPITVNGLTAATVVKVGGGFVYSVSVTLTGPCQLNDSATAAGVGTTNLMVLTPTALGVTQVNMRFNNGLVVTPTGSASVTFQ